MAELHFGYSEALINPPQALPLEGYKHREEIGPGNSGILDDLKAKALSLRFGDERILVVTLDLCLMSVGLADEIRSALSDRLELPVDYIVLALSHTHSGPVTCSSWKGTDETTDGGASVRDAIAGYLDFLKTTIYAISVESMSRQFECCVYTTTLRTHLGYNRRYGEPEAGGEVRMVFNLWENVGTFPDRLIDPDIPIVLLERRPDAELDSFMRPVGQLRTVLFNPAYHPVVLGHHSRFVSADYPGEACRSIEDALGAGTKAMCLLGACGNTHPWISVQQNPKAVEVVGRAVGYSVAAALARRERLRVDGIAAVQDTVDNENAASDRAVVQVIRLGELAFACISAECFTEIGLWLKDASPFEQTLVVSNANGCIGYLPTAEAFAEGGYEIQTLKSNRQGFLEKVRDVLKAHLAAVGG